MFSHGLGQLDYSALDLFSSQEEQLPLSFRALMKPDGQKVILN